MTRKSEKIAAAIEQYRGGELEPHYAGYFDCFNRQLFYEAHDVLEDLWLPQRHEPNGAFYKGLIQLAGAFVHLQKERLRPAAALFKLAAANLQRFPEVHERLDLRVVLKLIGTWLDRLESADFTRNPLHTEAVPRLEVLH